MEYIAITDDITGRRIILITTSDKKCLVMEDDAPVELYLRPALRAVKDWMRSIKGDNPHVASGQ